MNNLKVPLVIAFTPDYLLPAATCLSSVLQHSDREDTYHIICLLTEALPDSYQHKLKLTDRYNQLSFTFINLQNDLKDVYVDDKYTIAASYRLLIPKILPGYDKVIYLDCDMIIRNNLSKLYQTMALQNNYLAAVYESPIDFQLANIERIGCRPGEYINSGFLIMNLFQLRKDDMTRKFIQALSTDYLEFPDQDVLNMCCKGRITPLPPYYNAIRTFFLPQYKSNFLQKYTQEDWLAVEAKGNIHYTGGKPWKQYTVKFTEWWDVYKTLPTEIKKEWHTNKKLLFLYKILKTETGKKLVTGLQKLYRKIK